MSQPINKNNLHLIKNPTLLQYAKLFTTIEKKTVENILNFGIPLEIEKEKHPFLQTKSLQATYENNNKSIYINNISPACIGCRTGEKSFTSFVSLKCHRNCYFCFNENQDNYTMYATKEKDLILEIQEVLKEQPDLKYCAITGGEPLLFEKEVLNFLDYLNLVSPTTHTRLYTTGDLLTENNLSLLKESNLNEIRISIKMDDSEQKINHILKNIELSKKYIPQVMVEMPVIPGTLEEMKNLLLRLEEIGIFSINLLEFCYPLKDPSEFNKRGFQLKNPPYESYYNFWYAGGLAIAQSEELCLELLQFAIDNNFKMGVHYCSLENKFTGQIYQQNKVTLTNPFYEFSTNDYYYKTAKVFGKDIKKILSTLELKKIRYSYNREYDFLQLAPSSILEIANEKVEIAIISVVIEPNNVMKEVNLSLTTPTAYQKNQATALEVLT